MYWPLALNLTCDTPPAESEGGSVALRGETACSGARTVRSSRTSRKREVVRAKPSVRRRVAFVVREKKRNQGLPDMSIPQGSNLPGGMRWSRLGAEGRWFAE